MKRNNSIIIAFLLIVVFISCLIGNQIKEGMSQSSEIPKIIWTYWDGDPPDFVNHCIKSWKHYNDDHVVRVLNKENLSTYLPDVDFSKMKHIDNPTRFSDMVRLHVLAKFGGIWTDASIICNESFDWIHKIQNDKGCEFVGYYLEAFTLPEYNNKSKVIESWFFACIKGSKFVNEWCNEFSKISDYDDINKYVDSVKSEGVSIQKIDVPDYLTIHVSAQKVLQKADENEYNIYLLKAEDTAYKYLVDNDWNSEKAVNDGILGKKYLDSKIIKLRGGERNIISKLEYSDYFDF